MVLQLFETGRFIKVKARLTRLDLARRWLGDQRLAIKEVAQRLNFSTEFHFSRFFRRGTGLNPTRFRKRSLA
jgi:AraC-like DNA-binding protein